MTEQTIPVRVAVTQHLDAVQVTSAGPDVVLGVLVPQMRARLAADLAKAHLRPLAGWPAVQVHRYVWTSAEEWASTMLDPDAIKPPGMRLLSDAERMDGREPDLYQLELHTDAVPDTVVVEL